MPGDVGKLVFCGDEEGEVYCFDNERWFQLGDLQNGSFSCLRSGDCADEREAAFVPYKGVTELSRMVEENLCSLSVMWFIYGEIYSSVCGKEQKCNNVIAGERYEPETLSSLIGIVHFARLDPAVQAFRGQKASHH